jgi:hypothetical protein
VTLAALICAYQESSDPGDGLRATLRLAGRTVVERQARLASLAGANPVVVLVERLPPDLTAAIDRLRSEGISLVVARDAREAADAVPPEARLVLVGDGLVFDETQVERLTAAEGRALLTMPDHLGDDRFERIDAESRWAGLALIDGEMLRQTAAMLQDWDPQSTLLRRTVQAHARQIAVRDAAQEHLIVAEREVDLDEAEARIIESVGAAHGSWASRYLLAPVERAATALLMPSSITPLWIYLLAAVLTGLGAYLFTRDWVWAGVLLLLAATPLDGIADRLAALRLQPRPGRGWWRFLLPALSGAGLGTLAVSLGQTRGWGCLTLAAAALAFMLALDGELKGRDVPGQAALAERKGMTWLMVPFALGGYWTVGLAALAGYAAGSFFWAQRQVHRVGEPKQD